MKTVLSSCLFLFLSGCQYFQKTDAEGSLKTVDLLPGHSRHQHEAVSERLMIATQGEATTNAGLKMIKLGGNAVDAAAAASFAISVERPHSTGIGGGGFMIIDGPGLKNPVTIDFREKAPYLGHSKMFLNADGSTNNSLSVDGILASGVPGLVKGVYEAHKKYGKLPWSKVVQPAIDLAEKGFKIYPSLAKALKFRANVMRQFPASKKIFFKNDSPLEEGDLLVQRDLAKTLKAIQKTGADGFYRGWVADAIVSDFKKHGGLITKKDLEDYNVVWRDPVMGNFKGHKIYSMGPPSSGGTHVIQILNMLEPLKLSESGPQHPLTIHQTASAMQLAFVDRARYMGDSDFVKVPVKALTSKKYASILRKKITNKALTIEASGLEDAFSYESDETTHFTIVDSEGYAVSSTQTINYWMGSGVVVSGTGIVMNDEMDDFSKAVGDSNVFGAVGGENNLVEPGKRPLSSMSPTIVKKDGKTVLALGTPSGTRILTCVTQTILNYIEHSLSLWDAVAAVRYHHQWKPDLLRIEPPQFNSKTMEKISAMGHEVSPKGLGCKIQAIAVENDKLHGVSDPRGEGLAKGL